MKTRSSFVSNSSSTSFVLSFKKDEKVLSVPIESVLSKYGDIKCDESKEYDFEFNEKKLDVLKRFLLVLVKNKDNHELLSFLRSSNIRNYASGDIYPESIEKDSVYVDIEHLKDTISTLEKEIKKAREVHSKYEKATKSKNKIIELEVENGFGSREELESIIDYLVKQKKIKIIESWST